MWKSVSPLYRDRGCILRSGARPPSRNTFFLSFCCERLLLLLLLRNTVLTRRS